MPSSVIGLDVGGFGARVAEVENGGVVVRANEMSLRETPTVISFPSIKGGVRSAGASAQPHLITQPQSSIRQIRHLLGSKLLKKKFFDPQQDTADKLTPEGMYETASLYCDSPATDFCHIVNRMARD